MLTLLYLKNVLIFIENLQNSSLLTRTLTEVKNFVDLFMLFPKLNKSLLTITLTIWQREEQFPVKFYSFLLLKQILIKNNDDIKRLLLKNTIKAYCKGFSEFSWRLHEAKQFMKNSVVELMTISPSISFIVIYDQLKKVS